MQEHDARGGVGNEREQRAGKHPRLHAKCTLVSKAPSSTVKQKNGYYFPLITMSEPTRKRFAYERAAGVETRVFAGTLLAFAPYASPGAVLLHTAPRHTYLGRV